MLFTLLALVAALGMTGALHDPDPAPLRLRRETILVDGTRLSYHRVGDGPDVVLLHGGMGSAEDWEPVLGKLAPRFRVTALDRPGFGLSLSRGDDATYPGNARLVAGAVRALGLTRPVIVGHSHGGGVALAVAQQYPEVPGALVLLAPAAYPVDKSGLLERVTALPYVGPGLLTWVGPLVAPRTIAAILEKMIAPDASLLPPDFVSYRQQLWAAPRSLAVQARQRTSDVAGLTTIATGLHDVHVPSTIFGCDRDPTEGEAVDSQRLARELPDSKLWWLAGCGHFIQYSHPDQVVNAVVEMTAPGHPS